MIDKHVKIKERILYRAVFILISLLLQNSGWSADLTVPSKEYSGAIDYEKAVNRQNDLYPLSDQDNKGNWRLLTKFSDKFDADALNTKIWYPNNPKWKGRRPTYFHGSNVSVDNNELVIKVNQHGDAKLPWGFTHTSGFIKSREFFLYGYFEAELKCMDAPWVSCFWMCHVDSHWWTEIDICENCPGVNKNRHDLNSNVHVFKTPKEHGNVKKHFDDGKKYYLPFELQADYHVYGLEWNKDVIRFYFDGILFREVKNTHWHQPLQVNFNCESNKWFGAIPDNSKLNREYRVKYFRVWKQKDSLKKAEGDS